MSESFNLLERFDGQTTMDLARYVAKRIPVKSCVAIGVSEYYSCANPSDMILLELPTVSVVSSDGSAITSDQDSLLVESIVGAASEIVVGQRVKYSTDEYPVLAFGIESDDEYVGVLFVAILAEFPEVDIANMDNYPDLDIVQQAELVRDLELEITEMLSDDDDERPAEEDPYTGWYYGTLLGNLIFDDQA